MGRAKLKINRYQLAVLPEAERRRIVSRQQPDDESVASRAREIVNTVREGGDSAIARLTREIDGIELNGDQLRASETEFDEAREAIGPKVHDAIAQAIANIKEHHRSQLPSPSWMKEISPGVLSGERVTPIASVGIYVPRGKGSFPSVMAMLCIPAVLAGVPGIAVCTPPAPDGSIDAASLVAARMCGVEKVFRIGGAQAISALAYGTETIPKVAKIVGPGNRYVAAAKRLVAGVVDPGPPAGPSESVVICDGEADPEIVVRELLVEAEHGPDSAALLVTDSAPVADRVEQLLPDLIAALPAERRNYCETVLAGLGGIVLTRSLADSIEFANSYGPEHLRLLVKDPFTALQRVEHAGEVLLGENTSIVFGNFCIGLNAILPTGSRARSYSCMGVDEFLKRSSFAYVAPEGVASVGPVAATLADYEGFPAHAVAARYVMERNGVE